ncbi:hypothetical protein L7F22_055978 [Adiantum nelumboides]|nr:hypothetical protein [Adiantum nelumboides]
MIFIDEKKLLLTASTFFTCRLWTDTGVKIGQFGQSTAWDLKVPDTWASKLPTYVASMPTVRDLDSISSTRSSSRISTSAGTSGSRSANSRQASRGSLSTPSLESMVEQKVVRYEQKYGEAAKQDATDKDETLQYPYSLVATMLESGPPHLRLQSWFKPLQMAYNRKLPTKDLTPFGAVIPPNVSFIMKKCPRESLNVVAPMCNRKKSKVQDSPPRLSLPRFRFNATALTFTTIKSETSSGKSVSSLGDCCKL